MDRAPHLLDSGSVEPGTVDYMAECGIHQVGYQDIIGWRGPDEEEATFFELPADGHIQVAEIQRVAFDQNENRVRLTSTVFRGDRNQFVINVGAVPPSQMYFDEG